MFTRYTFFQSLDDITDQYDVKEIVRSDWKPSYNVSPGSDVPVIFAGHAMDRTLVFATWGGIPGTDASVSTENLAKFPERMRLVQRKRCVIPANGFYEWKQLGDTVSLPFYIRLLSRPFFCVAGIYDKLEGSDGKQVMVCSALLAAANSLLEPLSTHMPAILNDEDVSAWLNPLESNIEKQLKLIYPAEVTQMASFRVGSAVNDKENNDKSLISPVM